jgi:hypothetical protein
LPLNDAHRDGAKRFIYGMGWPDPYFNLDNALPEADLQKAQSLYESVNAQKESRLKWMRRNKGGDAIIDYVRKRIMQDVRNYEAKARQRSRRYML